jgi:hypothetical protein
MTVIDGNTLEGVSTTTLWTLDNRATEAGRPGGVLNDYDYLKFGEPNQSPAPRFFPAGR